jgi:N-acetylmuramoyl-L-alanine amidase
MTCSATRVCIGILCALLAGCGGIPPGTSDRAIHVPSPNHNERRPNYVILHDTTSNNVEHALKTLTDPAREVSAHYLIGRDGTLYQLVDENRRAWHAGASYWGGNTDLNSASIGIELDNTGDEPYAEAQFTRLINLLKDLRERYRIPAANILGHGDVAPRRKVDPGRYFPWEHLAKEGFGLWCDQEADFPHEARFDPLLALQAIGYDVSDPGAALAAFRRHFLGVDAVGDVSDMERQLMQCLASCSTVGRSLRPLVFRAPSALTTRSAPELLPTRQIANATAEEQQSLMSDNILPPTSSLQLHSGRP